MAEAWRRRSAISGSTSCSPSSEELSSLDEDEDDEDEDEDEDEDKGGSASEEISSSSSDSSLLLVRSVSEGFLSLSCEGSFSASCSSRCSCWYR